jgi:two-component system, cell cycle sensor histidine kinase and response regulator CckA
MNKLFGRFLMPKFLHGKENTPREARTLYLLLLCVFAFVLLNLVELATIYVRRMGVSAILLALIVISVISLWLLRRSRVRLASEVLVFGMWCTSTIQLLLKGGITGDAKSYYIVTCLIAGLLLGHRAVALCVFLTILSCFGMLVAESLGYPPPHYFVSRPFATFINFSSALILVLVPLGLFLTELKAALGASQKQLEDLEQTNIALRASEDRYRDLVEHSDDLICTHNLHGRLLTVNDPPLRILGFSRDELLGIDMRDLICPEARPEFENYLSEIQRTGFAKGVMAVRTRSGDWRVWEYHNTLRTEGVREPIVRGIAHDITERRRAEKALKESEEKFSKAFMASPTPIAIVTQGEGRFIEVNESFDRITGYERSEVIGQTALDLGIWAYPEERRQVVEDIRGCGHVQSREITFNTKSGSEIIVLYSAQPILIAGEQCLLAVAEDITARKRMEESLRASELQYRSLFHGAPYGICRASTDGRLLMANRALVEILGYDSIEELLSKNLETDIYVQRNEQPPIAESVMQHNNTKGTDTLWRRKDGRQILVRATVRVDQDELGVMQYCETIIEDITQRRALEKQMAQVQKMEAVALLAKGIAHDFNNLLTGILGNSELTLRSLQSGDPRRSRLQSMVQAALRGRDLTGQLLSFGQDRAPTFQKIDLNAEIRRTEDFLKRLIPENIEICFALDSSPTLVFGEEASICQILLNLAVNSRDAMPAGGKLSIRTTGFTRGPQESALKGIPEGEYVLLEVADTGCGMDDEVRQRIFEPFFTTKEPGSGTGLGLYTVYGIVHQCSGHIQVSSKSGAGTTFSIYFPTASVLVSSDREANQDPRTHSHALVLLVEDDIRVRDCLAEQLSALGFEVISAETSSEALQVAVQHDRKVSLLVTDVVMPHLSGPELARRLRERQPSVKVLYITGYASENLLPKISSGPDSEILMKPFTSLELSSKIDQLMGARASAQISRPTSIAQKPS